jgi:hypothetical protein
VAKYGRNFGKTGNDWQDTQAETLGLTAAANEPGRRRQIGAPAPRAQDWAKRPPRGANLECPYCVRKDKMCVHVCQPHFSGFAGAQRRDQGGGGLVSCRRHWCPWEARDGGPEAQGTGVFSSAKLSTPVDVPCKPIHTKAAVPDRAARGIARSPRRISLCNLEIETIPRPGPTACPCGMSLAYPLSTQR